MSNQEAIISYIETLCETVIALAGDVGSARKDRTLRQLRTAIDDYFSAIPPPEDLGVSVQDSFELGDIVG